MKYIFLVSVLLFSACSYKHDNLYVGSKKVTKQSVANTKKTQIFKDGKVRIFITVTYLDSFKNQKIVNKNQEQFIVGFHFVSYDGKEIEKNLSPNDLKIDIEDSTHLVNIRKLKSDNQILKIIPASNPWSQYFLVQTPRIKKNIIKFTLQVDLYKKTILKFEKTISSHIFLENLLLLVQSLCFR